jgi:predicted component of type VI protein secretion system
LEDNRVSLLKDLEQRFETLLEGFFARQFKTGVQPVEIAKKLSREMDTHRTISVSKVYVPNKYIIHVSVQDNERLKPFERTLLSELQSYLLEHAAKEGYNLVERPRLELKSTDDLILGQLRVESSLTSPCADNAENIDKVKSAEKSMDAFQNIDKTLVKTPSQTNRRQVYLVRIDPSGETVIPVVGEYISIGRSEENTVIIEDPNVSRQHALVEKKDGRFIIRDLESTNGTFVDGCRVEKHALHNGDTITIGTTKLQFRR